MSLTWLTEKSPAAKGRGMEEIWEEGAGLELVRAYPLSQMLPGVLKG